MILTVVMADMPLPGRTPTKEESRHMIAIANFGCVVCCRELSVFTLPEVHHMDGKTKPGAHLKTIPLCPRHHRIPSNDGAWVSRHGDGKKPFEAAYGTEEELLQWVVGEIASVDI